MNRRERRASQARNQAPVLCLEIHCAGPFSQPKPRQCDKSVAVPMPFTAESLRSRLWAGPGWYMTVVSPPGEEPMRCTVLCDECAEALIPELVAVAKQHMPGRA